MRPLFKIFGIKIGLHFSWWFIFALLAYSLSLSFFPHYYPNLSKILYWVMGISAALLLFVSVILHELSHSLTAKKQGIKVESITLFFFGGVASVDDEKITAKKELFMAMAGPLFSFFLGGFFYLLFKLNFGLMITAICFYLYQLNLILGAFNLLPGYPLDGGRVLRSILHYYYRDEMKSTYWAVQGGKVVAGLLVFSGILSLAFGLFNGLWFILLGGFLYFLANLSYQQTVLKLTLCREKVKRLTEKAFLIRPETTLDQMIRKKLFAGILPLKSGFYLIDFKKIDWKKIKGKWSGIKAKNLAFKAPLINEEDNLWQAFKLINQKNLSFLPVVNKKGRLKGIISQEKLNSYSLLLLEK